MKKIILITLASVLLLPIVAEHCGSCPSGINAATVNTGNNSQSIVLAPGKTTWIDNNHYVVYSWDKSPKIGNRILLVKVFNKNKQIVNSLNVTANAYMPSMRGAHDTGHKAMKLNKKNQYAIPVNFMMLGKWEIELKFAKSGKSLGTALVRATIK
ncbi:MAG TPA: FixH family protein [Candidatus Cloacimonadota bacterium]|nr:FixH family protein [Candidatus Cloacimonadota bacterium]